MPIPDKMSRKALYSIIEDYDSYIQNANDLDWFRSGWRPVCIDEFYDCELAEFHDWLDELED